jgi:hypothetical protein
LWLGSPHRDSVLVAAGNGALERLDSDGAAAYLDQITDGVSDVISLASSAALSGNLALNRGDLVEAELITKAVFGTLGQTKDDLLARTILCTAPLYAVLNGSIDVAEHMADDMVRAAQALGQPSGLAYAYYARGFVLSYGQQDHEAAVAALTESIELTHAGASDTIYPHALNALAREHLQTGQARLGVASLQLALAHSYRVGDMAASAAVTSHLVGAFAQLERDEDAAVVAGATQSGVLHTVYLDPQVVELFGDGPRAIGIGPL